MDLSKAFDTIDHNLLIRKLEYYGLGHPALKTLKSYLSNRVQYVDLNGQVSTHQQVNTGVPQGSILGPLLFIIYVDDLRYATKFFETICYADDTTLLFSIPKNLSTSEISITVNKHLNTIDEWFRYNKLSLNVSKTNYMILRGKKVGKFELNIEINQCKISEVDNFKFLGLIVDSNLNWGAHKKMLMSKLSRGVGVMKKLSSSFPKRILLTLYNALILSHLNLHIISWGKKSISLLKPQKKAIRAVFKARYNAHTTPLFLSAETPRVDDLYKLALIKFYYQLINETLPGYFLQLNIKTNAMLHEVPLNTRNRNKLAIPRSSPNALDFNVCTLVNTLPEHLVKMCENKSQKTFVYHVRKWLLDTYDPVCRLTDCFVCVSRDSLSIEY